LLYLLSNTYKTEMTDGVTGIHYTASPGVTGSVFVEVVTGAKKVTPSTYYYQDPTSGATGVLSVPQYSNALKYDTQTVHMLNMDGVTGTVIIPKYTGRSIIEGGNAASMLAVTNSYARGGDIALIATDKSVAAVSGATGIHRSAIVGGQFNHNKSDNSVILGGSYGEATRNSEIVTGAGLFGATGSNGESQRADIMLLAQFEDATPSYLHLPSGTSDYIALPNDSTVSATIDLVARVNTVGADYGKSAFWSFKALAVTDNVGVTTLVVNTKTYEGGDILWSTTQASLSATGNTLLVNAQGFGGTTTRWTATARLTQIKST
jgi:hypothetical protein